MHDGHEAELRAHYERGEERDRLDGRVPELLGLGPHFLATGFRR